MATFWDQARAMARLLVSEYFPPTLRGYQPSVSLKTWRSFRIVEWARHRGRPSSDRCVNARAYTRGLMEDPDCRCAWVARLKSVASGCHPMSPPVDRYPGLRRPPLPHGRCGASVFSMKRSRSSRTCSEVCCATTSMAVCTSRPNRRAWSRRRPPPATRAWLADRTDGASRRSMDRC